MVIGMGLAGMASALFSVNRGLSVVQVGMTGETVFSSGLLDLIGTHPIEERKSWSDPWAAIEVLVRDIPNHPYARLKMEDIRAGFEEVLSLLQEGDLPYCRRKEKNCEFITPLGTIKRTYCVPETMWPGVKALEERKPCLIVDFSGLKDFSASQIVSALQNKWPSLRAVRIPFPGNDFMKEIIPGEITAQTLEVPGNRETLAESLRQQVRNAHAVGMPALLGINRSHEIVAELGERVGVPIFEIPTFPVSVPGLRLSETFKRRLTVKGVQQFQQNRVLEIKGGPDGGFLIGIGFNEIESTVRAKAVILATGRFLGKGLYADRKRIRETIFDLPVSQPEDRTKWHCKDFLDPRGHAVNRAGLEVDSSFRPLSEFGTPAYEMLFAAGSILAHQDWKRMKCGSGLAIATARAAVRSLLELST